MSKLENILTTLYTSGALSNEEKMKKLLHPPRSLMNALYQNVLLPKNVKNNMQRSSSCNCSENHINLSRNVSVLIKLQTETCNFIKKGNLAPAFSCDFAPL